MRTLLLFLSFLVLPLVAHARNLRDYTQDYSVRSTGEHVDRPVMTERTVKQADRSLSEGTASLRLQQLQERLAKSSMSSEDRFRLRHNARADRLRDFQQMTKADFRLTRTEEAQTAREQERNVLRLEARRVGDLRSILYLLMKFVANPDLRGAELLPSDLMEICKTGYPTCPGGVNLDVLLAGSEFVAFPVDPENPEDALGTGYSVQKIAGNKLRLSAPLGNRGEGLQLE